VQRGTGETPLCEQRFGSVEQALGRGLAAAFTGLFLSIINFLPLLAAGSFSNTPRQSPIMASTKHSPKPGQTKR